MLYNFSVEFEANRIHLKQEASKSNGTNKLLFYADDVNILCGSVHAIEKNPNTWIAANNETGLKFMAGKTKYISTSRNKKWGWSHNTEIDNSYFTWVEDFKYLVTQLKNQYYIKE